MKVVCGDANPKGNVWMMAKGGCRGELEMEDAYRCTGCGVWFHKDCILEHFKKEKTHDWGREEERKKMNKKLSVVKDLARKAMARFADEPEDYDGGMTTLMKIRTIKLIK